ncbi:MAG: hypothetical protein AAGA54_10140, partial [Myxococcota bacterium]
TAAKKKTAAKKPPAKPVTKDVADAHAILAELSNAAATPPGEALAVDPQALVAQLEAVASPALLPDLLGALEDEDPYGILWSVFYLAENMDDAYLQALLDAMPGLHARAPRWAETALIRIWNTHDEPDDCTPAFLAQMKTADASVRAAVLEVTGGIARDLDDLVPKQRAALAVLVDALGGDASVFAG